MTRNSPKPTQQAMLLSADLLTNTLEQLSKEARQLM